jgi:hypothetical protein
VPLIERSPGAFEEQPLDVEPETLAEEDDVACDARQTQANRQQIFVDQRHLQKNYFLDIFVCMT